MEKHYSYTRAEHFTLVNSSLSAKDPVIMQPSPSVSFDLRAEQPIKALDSTYTHYFCVYYVPMVLLM